MFMAVHAIVAAALFVVSSTALQEAAYQRSAARFHRRFSGFGGPDTIRRLERSADRAEDRFMRMRRFAIAAFVNSGLGLGFVALLAVELRNEAPSLIQTLSAIWICLCTLVFAGWLIGGFRAGKETPTENSSPLETNIFLLAVFSCALAALSFPF